MIFSWMEFGSVTPWLPLCHYPLLLLIVDVYRTSEYGDWMKHNTLTTNFCLFQGSLKCSLLAMPVSAQLEVPL